MNIFANIIYYLLIYIIYPQVLLNKRQRNTDVLYCTVTNAQKTVINWVVKISSMLITWLPTPYTYMYICMYVHMHLLSNATFYINGGTNDCCGDIKLSQGNVLGQYNVDTKSVKGVRYTQIFIVIQVHIYI